MGEAKMPKMGFEGKGAEAHSRLGDCLWDAHSAGTKILEFSASRSFAEYEESEPLRCAIEKMLEILAEAVSEIRRDFPAEFAKLDGGSKVIEAAGTSTNETIWRVVEEMVPEMTAQVHTMLDEWHQA